MQHVLNGAEIPRAEVLLGLLLREPLVLAQAEQVALQVRLAGHDARAHEEGPDARPLELVVLVRRVEDVVARGGVADDPGVHVDAGGLGQDALSGLVVYILAMVFFSGKER